MTVVDTSYRSSYNSLEGPRPELVVPLDNPTDEFISIIIVHRNRGEYLNICLQSIGIMSINNNYEIIVVDNGSTDPDSLRYLDDLQQQNDVKVIRNAKNLWWSAAANQGAKAASSTSSYLVFMHPDVVVLEPTWLDTLINCSEAKDAGVVGVEAGTYEIARQRIDYCKEWLLLTTRECWRDCGPFRSEELPQVGSAFIYSYLAAFNNYKVTLLTILKIAHHFHSYSTDVSEMERFNEKAGPTVAKIITSIQQQQAVGK